jgi:hypothetical protein
MKKVNIRATIFVYSLVLVSVSLIMAFVVLNNFSTLIVNEKTNKIDKKLYNSIKSSTKF